MAHSYHHAVSSARKWGGTPDDYLAVHTWIDRSKEMIADFRHRALRHHAEDVFMAETIFGTVLIVSTGRVVPVRLIAEQHIMEDLGRIPSFADWMRCIRPEPWMGRVGHMPTNDDGHDRGGGSCVTGNFLRERCAASVTKAAASQPTNRAAAATHGPRAARRSMDRRCGT